MLLLTWTNLITTLARKESASKAIRWLSLLEHTSSTCVRCDWVRVHSKCVCLSLRLHLLGLLVILTSLNSPLSRILIIRWTSDMELLGVVAMTGVLGACHVLARWTAILSYLWWSTPSSWLCLVLREVNRSTATLLERAHVWLTEGWLISISCRVLSHVCWLIICPCFILVTRSRIVVVKNDVVIVLFNVTSQVKVLSEETDKFITRSIVGNQCWLRIHLC